MELSDENQQLLSQYEKEKHRRREVEEVSSDLMLSLLTIHIDVLHMATPVKNIQPWIFTDTLCAFFGISKVLTVVELLEASASCTCRSSKDSPVETIDGLRNRVV